MSLTNGTVDRRDDRYLRPVSQPRPVAPFAVSCRFDRARGEFVVRAGARAGAMAVCTVAVLALGTFAYVRSFLAPAPVILAKTPPPVAAPAVKAKTPEHAQVEPETEAEAEADAPAVTTTPAMPVAKELQWPLPRTPGLNYLVLKSLPSNREAVAACETLEAKGIAASVEQNLPGWSHKASFAVVGLTGFDLHREQQEFDRHVKDLKKLKLDPKPYKWRGGRSRGDGQPVSAARGRP